MEPLFECYGEILKFWGLCSELGIRKGSRLAGDITWAVSKCALFGWFWSPTLKTPHFEINPHNTD